MEFEFLYIQRMLNRITLNKSYGFTEHAFTHNVYVDALQQEAASIKTFCRLRSTSFSKTVGSHESSLPSRKVENCTDGADNNAYNSLHS